MNPWNVEQLDPFTIARAEHDARTLPDPVIKGRRPMPYPNGWFALCYSDELKPGDVRIAPFMGHELVVYRTARGEAHVVEPYCPHLGAHLGHGGKVDGDDLVCPFHGLSFGPDGTCTRAPGHRVPPRAALVRWMTCDRNGVVLVWRDSAGRPPDWEIDEIETDQGFSPSKRSCDLFDGYLHDVGENSADVVHFAHLHGFTDTTITHEVRPSSITFDMTGQFRGVLINMHMVNYGVGCVIGTSTAESLGATVLTQVFITPTAPLKWTLRVSNAVRISRVATLPAVLRKPVNTILVTLAHRWAIGLAKDDFPIWNHRNFVDHPKLMAGEASIAAYRRWMKQFYPE
ncbi:2Fe-2S ferredoxin [Burkholderia cepacia]|uniref:Rieske 2Fe-2S domain-containing protein n=1 Tax=Burkholderia cepacia TaxID=292 RepID=UPI000752E274|nr:Rieske 2Fe-2S domain-containing protein [Burkholderia cepacia]KVQ49999.1 2Fe-2S ferredoxin [Burkholderia cepacia]